jgi:TonB-dependent SusC/RagA subfamily outer membrane receptor
MRKTLLFLHLMLLLSAVAFSQSRIVTGQVKDENGSPVPYATIALRKNANSANTTAGVSSDAKGNFKIDVGNATSIVVTSAGFTAKEVGVPVGTNTISIQLGSAAEIINEVVVTALGIRREKRQLATATQTINADQINNSGTGNALSELNGKVSGLTVINSGGDPGGGTYMRLRGVTSITGNNQPLMVVDGVPIDNSINNYDATSSTPNVSGANSNLTGGVQPTNRGVDINPNDIESVTLLKGPAATALYGIQAASGALIITTKKGGGKGGTSISFNSSTTFDKVSQLPARQSIYSQGGDGVYQGPTDGSNRRLTWGSSTRNTRKGRVLANRRFKQEAHLGSKNRHSLQGWYSHSL